MARRSADADDSPSRRQRFRINLFLDPTVKPQAEWSDHTPVPSALLDKLTCDGTLTPIFVEAGKPVSVGRSLRITPDRTRRLVLYRDGRTPVPVPPTEPTPTPIGRYRHPLGDHMGTADVWVNRSKVG